MAPPSSSALAAEAPSKAVIAERDSSSSPPPKKYRSMKELMRITPVMMGPPPEYDDDDDDDDVDDEYLKRLCCSECGSGKRDEEMIICDKCANGFHMMCLRPVLVRLPIGPWFCHTCEPPYIEPPLKCFTQKSIIDFFKIQKCTTCYEEYLSLPDPRKRKKKSGPAIYRKRRRRLIAYIPTENPQRRMAQLGSLAGALMALNIEYTDKLVYVPGMASKSANQAKFEKGGGMQVLCKEDIKTMEICLDMYRKGLCPPLIVSFDSFEGYTVEADAPIKDLTFIVEYAGDVDFIKNRKNDDCDSMMTLLSPENESKGLLICPDKRGNIARFINGINNHLPESRKKQNLKCVRYDVNGECRVLLVASRDIAKGERLYYDYNGDEHEYPTHHFI